MKNPNLNLHYGANAETFRKAQSLRSNQTDAEIKLWDVLKKGLKGYKFRRQHPIDIFIVDFYSHKAKLVIEVDGEVHNKPDIIEYDSGRTKELEEFGLNVIRFSNQEIFNKMEEVILKIAKHLP